MKSNFVGTYRLIGKIFISHIIPSRFIHVICVKNLDMSQIPPPPSLQIQSFKVLGALDMQTTLPNNVPPIYLWSIHKIFCDATRSEWRVTVEGRKICAKM